jgi:alcohol dehydrogenase class IV
MGPAKLDQLRELVAGRTLIVTTPGHTRRGLTDRVRQLTGNDVRVFDRVEPNPTLDQLRTAIRELRGDDVDTIVGLG